MAYVNSKPELVVNLKPERPRPSSADSLRRQDYQNQWRKENREKVNVSRRKWADKNRHIQHAHSHINTLRCRYPDVSDNITAPELSDWIKENRGKPCRYCDSESTHIDHKTPLSKGGEHSFLNIQMICAACNRAKNDSTEEDFLVWIEKIKRNHK